jgi:hypothetical protein
MLYWMYIPIFLSNLSLAYSLNCSSDQDGICQTLENGRLQICGSGYWQYITTGSYQCIGNQLSPEAEVLSAVAQTSTSTYTSVGPATSSTTSLRSVSSTAGTTGYWDCLGVVAPIGEDSYGVKSYKPNGTMASVYDATPDAAFRCGSHAPSNDLYAAVWTRYNDRIVSQPMPKNCNGTMTLTNPKTGKSVVATIIDRCQSCVGVNHQTSDPTTPESVVNGATIDLSRTLWNELYEGAPDGVYDVLYDGPIYSGSWDGEPDPLTSPNCI